MLCEYCKQREATATIEDDEEDGNVHVCRQCLDFILHEAESLGVEL